MTSRASDRFISFLWSQGSYRKNLKGLLILCFAIDFEPTAIFQEMKLCTITTSANDLVQK